MTNDNELILKSINDRTNQLLDIGFTWLFPNKFSKKDKIINLSDIKNMSKIEWDKLINELS